jgi:hypothetical protein
MRRNNEALGVRKLLAAVAGVATVASAAGVATAVCWVAGQKTSCCELAGPSGPNQNRYCGIWPFGNYCNDSVRADVHVQTVVQSLMGRTGTISNPGYLCVWDRNSCAAIGCKWLESPGQFACLSETVTGDPCDESGGPN